MARRKAEVTGKLEKLRAKMAKVAKDTSGGSGFWYPDAGEHTIRILPPVGEMEFFFQEVAKYEFPDGTKFYSAEFTTDGELQCPIRELVKELYRSGDPEDKELAKKLNSWPIYQERYWMNIITRQEGDDGGNTGEGPFIFTAPPTIFQSLMTLVNSPDYGDISDPEYGIDIIIVRTGEGINTEYNVYPRRYDTPLHTDKETADKWLEEATDLSWVELSEDPEEDSKFSEGAIIRVLPYNRVMEETGLHPDAEIDEIVSVISKQKPSNGRDSSVKAKLQKLKKEQEEDEEAFPVEEADDEVGEAIKEAKQQRRRRRRR